MWYAAAMAFITVPLQEVRQRLQRLNQAGIQALSELSSVPFISINKIKYGITKEPGYSTVCAFLPHIEQIAVIKAHQSREYRKTLTDTAEAPAAKEKS